MSLSCNDGIQFPQRPQLLDFIHYSVRRLTTRSLEISKPRDIGSKLSDRSEILQTYWLQGCPEEARQIWQQYDKFNN